MNKLLSSIAVSAMLLGGTALKAQGIFNAPKGAAKAAGSQGRTATGIPVNAWQAVAEGQAPARNLMRYEPVRYKVYSLNESAMKAVLTGLAEDGSETAIISLPMPDGTSRDFRVWQQSMMPAELAARFPDIKTFTAEAVGDSRITAKLDLTTFGFHAVVFESGNTSFIDPYDNLHDGYYAVHYKKDESRTMPQRMKCEVKGDDEQAAPGQLMQTMQTQLPKMDMKKSMFDGTGTTVAGKATSGTTAQRTSNGWNLRTYRIAVAANHEYCQAVTGLPSPSIAACLSAITTTMNRVNGVYNREFSVQMNFAAGESSIIWPTATGSVNGTDPFNGLNTNASACLTQNQLTCDAVIGNGNYDIGHVFTTGAGGLASLGIVCNNSFKAQGVTGSSSPSGDGYDIDYVAHEIGHEFGSSHTFNNNSDGSCGGNSSATHAYEPGSGATIMDYAGICSPDDLQPHSDPYFSASSLQQICILLAGSENVCAAITPTGNDTGHLVGFNATYNIPYKTPFELTGPTATLSAPDTAVTYCWYQWNLGTGTDLGARLNATYRTGPIFRSFQPAYTPYRMFPKRSLVLSGVLSDAGIDDNEGEKAPDTARYLTFKMNLRTILGGKGCLNMPDDTVHINVSSTGAGNGYQGFRVTSQNTAVTYAGGSTQTVTWNVVGTNAAPVSASTVDIYMSTDGALTCTLLGNYPNTGTASVALLNPATTSSTVRIKVKGSGNVFFNINGSNFTVTHFVAPVVGPITGTFTVCTGSTTTLADTSLGGTWSSSVPAVATVNVTTGVVTGITAGTTTITYTAPAGFVTQEVTVNAAPVAGTITGATTLCVGATTTFANATGTPGGTWSTSNITRATIDAAGVATGVSAGAVNITYTATNSCGSVSAVRPITINAAPVVAAIGGTLSLCSGASTTLTDATPLGVWSSVTPSVAAITAGGLVTAGTAGTTTISYTVTNISGCSAAATAVFTTNAIPAASTSPAGAVVICTGSTIVLNALPGTGAYTYQWQQGGIDISGETANNYTASTAGNYRVVITSAAGCTGTSAVVNVTVSSSTVVVPSVSIAASPGLVVCATGVPVTFTATPVNGGSTPGYAWTVNGTAAPSTTATYTYIPANGDIVACTLTSSSPCASPTTATASVTMTVTPAVTPTVGISVLPGDVVCTGQSVTYNAVPVFGGTAPTYQWAVNGVIVATGPSFTTVPANGDMVVCTMTSNYTPCLATPVAVSSTLTMHVDAPSVNSVTISASSASAVAGTPVTFVAIAPHGGLTPSYQWYIGFTAVPGATNITFTTSTLANGDIVYCKVTTSDVCATPHTAISGGFTMLITTGLWETTASGGSFVLVPNPTKGTFAIKGKMGAGSDGKVNVVITNMLGQAIYTGNAEADNGDLNTQITLSNGLPNGMYFVTVVSGGDRVVFHLSVDK